MGVGVKMGDINRCAISKGMQVYMYVWLYVYGKDFLNREQLLNMETHLLLQHHNQETTFTQELCCCLLLIYWFFSRTFPLCFCRFLLHLVSEGNTELYILLI